MRNSPSSDWSRSARFRNMITIGHARRLVAIGAAAAITTTVMLASPAEGAGSGTTLAGTISWTTTITTAKDEPGGDALNGTETRQVTMKVRMTKRPGAYGFQVEDNGSSYTGAYTLSQTRLERDIDGTVDCTVTHDATGSASGPLPKKPKSTTAPAMFAQIAPSTSSLGARTKAIVLTPILRYAGTDTITYTGSGLSPCQSGQDVDPIDGSLAPNDNSQQICYPAGTSARVAGASAGEIVGAWKAKKHAFVFTCSQSWTDVNGRTTTTTITRHAEAEVARLELLTAP